MNETDLLLVNRGGKDFGFPVTELETLADDLDLLVVNRDGVDYKVTMEQFKDYINETPPKPWEGEAIYHVIVTDPSDITVYGHNKIYNLNTEQEVSSIPYAGEWIITGAETSFKHSIGNWDFGEFTDTRLVNDMDRLFYQAKAFNSDISMFDTSNVTNMYEMFDRCEKFNQDISGWDVSTVWNMGSMFYRALVFNSDISGWDVSNVQDMNSMMYRTKKFNHDLSGWDVSNVNNMVYLFYEMTAFDSDLSNWCVTNVTSKPPYFNAKSGMPVDNSHDPDWGSCPRGEDTK